MHVRKAQGFSLAMSHAVHSSLLASNGRCCLSAHSSTSLEREPIRLPSFLTSSPRHPAISVPLSSGFIPQ
eukprot:CAMPEP_0173441808 /NCGR_PEP_ID=MMETSP1357-20121228/24156_1 /TAXON_ID=77926 /ORGANISM="Hemiselmis rufescens, Strain PCC563" /LENGTH=69 /DNA_ID=CAMNT_0014407411 /DNA_START=276 /DNA_END=482 /DNA_ORIENTATION=+